MSTSSVAGPSEAPQPPAQPKLKNSCDMCSASKTRCESQKPACSRCLKLGYPCFYSAARRVGRRHGSRRAAPGNPSAPRQVLRTLIERQGPPSSSYGPSHEPTRTGLSPQQTSQSQGGFHQDVSSSCSQASLAPRQVDSTLEEAQESRSRGDSPLSAPDRQSQSPHYQAVGGCQQQPGQSMGNAKHKEPQGMVNKSSPTDCAVVTMMLQEQLDGIYQTLCSTATQPRQSLMGNVDVAMGSISSALDRLSTVLICPCSEKLDISLLVGSACMAIMDIYGLIVKLSTSPAPLASWSPHQTGPSSAGNSRSTSITMEGRFEDDDPQYWALSSLSPRAKEHSRRLSSFMDLDDGEQSEESGALECIVEQLPKLAGVTLQFTKRSRTMNGSNTVAAVSEVAYALASFTRTRLQTIKNEVTGQLLQRT